MVRTLDVIGERWTMLLLRQAFYGVRRFDEMQAELGVSRKVLTERLGRMVRNGLLLRVPYREPGQRTRHEYRLTPKGEALGVALVALMQWGDRHLPALPRGRPLLLRDRESGQEVRAALVREDGAEVARRALVSEFWPDPEAARRA